MPQISTVPKQNILIIRINTTKRFETRNVRLHAPMCRIYFNEMMPGGSDLRLIIQHDFDHARGMRYGTHGSIHHP